MSLILEQQHRQFFPQINFVQQQEKSSYFELLDQVMPFEALLDKSMQQQKQQESLLSPISLSY